MHVYSNVYAHGCMDTTDKQLCPRMPAAPDGPVNPRHPLPICLGGPDQRCERLARTSRYNCPPRPSPPQNQLHSWAVEWRRTRFISQRADTPLHSSPCCTSNCLRRETCQTDRTQENFDCRRLPGTAQVDCNGAAATAGRQAWPVYSPACIRLVVRSISGWVCNATRSAGRLGLQRHGYVSLLPLAPAGLGPAGLDPAGQLYQSVLSHMVHCKLLVQQTEEELLGPCLHILTILAQLLNTISRRPRAFCLEPKIRRSMISLASRMMYSLNLQVRMYCA